MTEDKEIDNISEKNMSEGAELEKGIESPEQPDNDKLEENTAGEAAETQNPLLDDASKTSPVEEKPPEEMQAIEDFDLNLLLDIPLEIKVELGRAKVQIQELLNLGPGSTVSLSKLEGEPVDILANDKLIAKGEVVLQNKKYGIRITEITSRMNRIKSLS